MQRNIKEASAFYNISLGFNFNPFSYLYNKQQVAYSFKATFSRMRTAIILGATGLTGGYLLQEILGDPLYNKVILFSRSKVAVKDDKIEEHIIDMFKLDEYEELFQGDDVFCCIGTTKSNTPDEDTYRKIDFGIPAAAARLARKNGIPRFLVISALGADPTSNMFYNKTKGEMEQAVLANDINKTYIFQPSLIAGDRVESRFFENLAKNAMKVINPILGGSLKKYRSIHPETIAAAMKVVAKNAYPKTRIESDQIKEIADSAKD